MTLYSDIRTKALDFADGSQYALNDDELALLIDGLAYEDSEGSSTGWRVDIIEAALEYARAVRVRRADLNPERAQHYNQRVEQLEIAFVIAPRSSTSEAPAPGSGALPDSGPPSGGGGLQRVISDSTLSGFGTSLSPLGVADNAIDADKIADGAVGGDAIAPDGIQGGAIDDTDTTTAGEVVNLLGLLSGSSRLDALTIKNIPAEIDRQLGNTTWRTGGGGGGLAAVTSDSTLSGAGTVQSPLSVANPFTAADETKLDAIEAGAQKNVGVEFTQAEKTKLGGVESGATADQSGAEIVTALSGLSGNARLPAAAVRDLPTGGGGLAAVTSDATLTGNGTSGSPLGVANPFTAADETKLDSIDAGAEVNLFVGVFGAAPAVANYTAGQVYYNSADNRLYELIAPAAMSATLTFTITPRNTAAQGGGDNGAGFNADTSDPVNERYGVSPLTGWLKLQQVVDTGGGQTRYYLESEANDAIFGGQGFSITLADGRTLHFTRESSSGGVSNYTSTGEEDSRIFQVGAAQSITVHANGTTPFTAGVNKQWHYLQVGPEQYNALTSVSVIDDDLVFGRRTGAAVTADLEPYKQASWATAGNTDLIPAAKIPVAESLIDGNGIGLTSGGGQSLRGPLRLFDPPGAVNWDLDDTDKQTGVYHIRVQVNITDADSTTSFRNNVVDRAEVRTARMLGSVLRQDSNRYADTGNLQGERIGNNLGVYRGSVLVGTLSIWLATDNDSRLGYYLDWVRASGSSSISFTLTNFRIDFAHSDTSGTADSGASTGTPGVLSRASLSAAIALQQPNANTINSARWQDVFTHTVTAAEAARGFMDINANVYAQVASGTDTSGNRPLLAVRLIQGSTVRSENYRYFRLTAGTPLDCILSEVLEVETGDVIKVQAQMIRLSAATATLNAMVTTASHWSRFSFSGGGGGNRYAGRSNQALAGGRWYAGAAANLGAATRRETWITPQVPDNPEIFWTATVNTRLARGAATVVQRYTVPAGAAGLYAVMSNVQLFFDQSGGLTGRVGQMALVFELFMAGTEFADQQQNIAANINGTRVGRSAFGRLEVGETIEVRIGLFGDSGTGGTGGVRTGSNQTYMVIKRF